MADNKTNIVVDIETEFIKLNQFLKLVRLISNGSEDKSFMLSHVIKVNNKLTTERGKKLYNDDKIEIMINLDFKTYIIKSSFVKDS